MGFQRTLTALLNHLPKSRQTLLFSATQTKSVTDLARLSLKDPVQIGIQVSDPSQSFLPQKLEQHYLLVELDKKLDVLWSFIKTHLQSKIIVFMSSCNQVRFVFETFCKMHPGVSLLQLQGKQKQSTRLTMYQKFTTTSHAVLFATDIAARGLDFPLVDWVVQLDAPEDADTYIHRVGRTARYESKGKGLLFLLPSEEEGMKTALQTKGIQVSKIKNRPSKTQNIQNQLQNLCFQDPEIKYLGQRVCGHFFLVGFISSILAFRHLYHTCDPSICTGIKPYSRSKNSQPIYSQNHLVFLVLLRSSFLGKSLSNRGRMLRRLLSRRNRKEMERKTRFKLVRLQVRKKKIQSPPKYVAGRMNPFTRVDSLFSKLVVCEQSTIACSRERIKMCFLHIIPNS